MLPWAVGIVVALDAAAAVHGAQVPKGRIGALAVFVALEAHSAVFITTVSVARAIDFFAAGR